MVWSLWPTNSGRVSIQVQSVFGPGPSPWHEISPLAGTLAAPQQDAAPYGYE
jgi:hypothetical protein